MNDPRTTLIAREKALYQYTSALERGDFEALAEILHAAEDAPELARMIEEINDMYAIQNQAGSQVREKSSNSGRKKVRQTLIWIAAALGAFVVVLFIAPLFLMNRMMSPGAVGEPAVGPTPTSLPMATPTAPSAIQVTGAPTLGPDQGSPVAPQEPMIIKNGEIELIVEDTQSAIDQVTNIATDNGGYVLSSQSSAVNGRATAIMTIAVRAENFEIAMRRLRDISMEVVRETSSGQDVSTEYVDLQSRLRNLEATRDRIRALLDQATTVEDALEINRQLSEIEAQIEQVKGRMTYLTGRAAFSTITVTLNEYIPTTPTPTPTPTLTPTPTSPWSLGPRIDAAVETQKSMGRSLLELLVWLIIVPGPYLVGLALIVWIVRTVMRRRQP
jgi:hypothetical protein